MRPREEEREEERDRAERLLAAREQREPRHPLAGGAQLDLDARLRVLVLALELGLGQAQPALAAREERGRDLREVVADGCERLGEAALDGLGELVAQALELLEALLEVGALLAELGQPLLLALVLLFRERVDAAEASRRRSSRSSFVGQLFGIVALGGLGAGLLHPPLQLLRLGGERGELDVDGRRTLTGLGGRASQLRLLRTELAQLLAQLLRALAASVGAGTKARLEARRDLTAAARTPAAAQPLRPGVGSDAAGLGRRRSAAVSSASISASSARRRASSSSSTASAASPAYQSSPRSRVVGIALSRHG